MSPLAAPPEDLTGFPESLVTTSVELYRIHRADRRPWWFSSNGDGRFDLSRTGKGTCYVAERELGAFVEVFRTDTVIPSVEVEIRRLSRLYLPGETRLADCTVRPARAFGVTAAIHSTSDYGLPRAWADAFDTAGFGGIRYRVSHDPSQEEIGIAVFGPAGLQEWTAPEPEEIGGDLLAQARREFGLVVVPTPM